MRETEKERERVNKKIVKLFVSIQSYEIVQSLKSHVKVDKENTSFETTN
jgi:hypothetical protein